MTTIAGGVIVFVLVHSSCCQVNLDDPVTSQGKLRTARRMGLHLTVSYEMHTYRPYLVLLLTDRANLIEKLIELFRNK
ncbi:hypothetical protein J3F83DRAFT_332864 [Trichoderma novae-zelandiae]